MSTISLERAFMLMLGNVTAADASRRQVNGILSWRDLVHHAQACGAHLGSGRGSGVPHVPSITHRSWLMACAEIVEALMLQAHEAEAERHRCLAAAASAEAAAAEADAMADALEDDDDEDDDEDGGNAAAIAALREQAAEFRATAAIARKRAEDATTWEIAAREAVTAGEALTATEDAIARPVGQAIAAAGGVREVPGEKRYLTGVGGAR